MAEHGETPDRIDPWGARTPYSSGQSWPRRVDIHLADGVGRTGSRSVGAVGGGAAFQRRRARHRRTRRPDRRGAWTRRRPGQPRPTRHQGPVRVAGNNAADRLTTPLIRRGGELGETDWDTAMDVIVQRSRTLLAGPGPSSIAFYTSGQLFLEEYYTQGVIAHGAIGTNHVDGKPGCAPPPLPRPSKSLSAATASRGRTPMSTTRTSSRATATTSPKPRPCCGCGCSTGSPVTIRRRSSASTRGPPWWRATLPSTSRRCRAPTSR